MYINIVKVLKLQDYSAGYDVDGFVHWKKMDVACEYD